MIRTYVYHHPEERRYLDSLTLCGALIACRGSLVPPLDPA